MEQQDRRVKKRKKNKAQERPGKRAVRYTIALRNSGERLGYNVPMVEIAQA